MIGEDTPIVPQRPRSIDSMSEISLVAEKIRTISSTIDASDEIGALLHGFDSGYIEPVPSGLLTWGKHEILPTGRNFYSLDPFKMPTKVGWRIREQIWLGSNHTGGR